MARKSSGGSTSTDDTTPQICAAGASAVASNDDLLLTEILARLPAKPLTQFKSVSKHWLSLISQPQLPLLHARRRQRKPTSALFLRCPNADSEFSFVPLEGCLLKAPHFRSLAHPGTTILHSCNGLFCYSKLDETTGDSILRYYVCNPTIKRFTRIPLLGVVYDCRIPNGDDDSRVHHKLCNYKIDKSTRPWSELNITLVGVYVAFDPLVSPHYSVVCVWEWNAAAFNYKIRIAVFRSEIGLWGELMGPFTVPDEVLFENGVFWNGGVHWISNSELVRFDMEGGCLKVMPLPLSCGEEKVAYFGESRGHLQVVINDKDNDALFNVFEMNKEFSGWVSVFCCDLNRRIFLSAEMFPYFFMNSAFSLVFLGRGECVDESFFVVEVSGKLFYYDIKNQTPMELCDLPHSSCYKAFPYDETLFEV